MSPSPLFHVGYHKTGTTWMQRRLFQPEFGYDPVMDHDDVSTHIVRPHRFAYDPGALAALIPARASDPALVPVISSEIMSGHPFWGGRESYDLANRIHEAVPDARILLTIRAQIPAITSVYMQYVRRGGRLPIRDFYVGERSVGYDRFDPIHFEYHHLVGHYQKLFGADRVHVLTQERLASDPDGFVASLAEFTQNPLHGKTPSTAREGVSEAEVSTPILRRINHFRREAAGLDPVLDLTPLALLAYRGVGWGFRRPFMKRLLGARKPVRKAATELFAGRFAASNQALLSMCPDLELPGYEI